MEQIQHRVLNSVSDHTLDFDAEPGLKAIVHGGNNLGRGLTFKGLVTTYLLKQPSHLTSLIQIQRWCGYRHENGESVLDLCRLYLTEERHAVLQRNLAIDKYNRAILSSYALTDIRPDEVGPRLQEDPNMALVARHFQNHSIGWIELLGETDYSTYL